MALTQEQWYSKLKKCFPRWYFIDELHQKAHLNGLSAVLSELQSNAEGFRDETFFDKASRTYINVHANERSVERLYQEVDASLVSRIKKFVNVSNRLDLKTTLDLILLAGEALIIEDFEIENFCDRETHCNRNAIFVDTIKDAFSVVVDYQVHEPFSFSDREYFADREGFVGMAESSDRVFESIISIVNKNKAHGTLYRIIERRQEI